MRAERIYSLLKDFMALPTVTGTADENLALPFYQNFFEQCPYFRERPDHWGTWLCPEDRFHRKVMWGLVRGKSPRTVVLIHHMDVVDVTQYERYQKLAYLPDGIKPILQNGSLPVSDDVKGDLDGEDWIFGRGACDMKAGAAIEMTLLEEYAAQEDVPGSLLLLAVPDEETGSAGMRAAASLFEALEKKFGLQFTLMVDTEPHGRMQENAYVIHDGSIGKMMPVVLARGKSVHLGNVYDGLNPIHLMSALARETELWPEMVERRGNTTTPGATWLSLRDRRTAYNVSLPATAGGYLNVLTLTHTPKDVLHALCRSAAVAGAKVIASMKERYAFYRIQTPEAPADPFPAQVQVLTFGALKQAVLSHDPEAISIEAPILKRVQAGACDLREGALELMEAYLARWESTDPCFVIGLAAPYYPPVNNSELSTQSMTNRMVSHLSETLQSFGLELQVDNYFKGICDLSYAMFTADASTIDFVAKNLVFWGEAYEIPLALIQRYSMPVFNIGPWGKDLHNLGERVNRKDLIEHTPALIQRVIEDAWNEA